MVTLIAMVATALFAVGADRGFIGPATAWTFTSLVVMVAGFSMIDRSLIRERLRSGQKGEDPVRVLMIRLLILIHIVAGLVAAIREASSPFPPSLRIAALFPYAAGMMATWWALASNPFFIPVMRIQEERGHRVVTGGPYRFVRHPGYSGLIVALPFSGIALGSWFSVIAAAAAAVLFAVRAGHEDAFLKERLPSYRSYSEQVRFRLIPGVW